MNYILTISAPEPGASFRRFHAHVKEGGDLRVRGLVTAHLPTDEHQLNGINIYAKLCWNGVHIVTFIVEGGSFDVHCSDIPEIIPRPATVPCRAGSPG